MLVDEAFISVKAGKGGDGAVSFRREKYVSRGGPDGGDGGDGGDVIIKCSGNTHTLLDYVRVKSYKAEDGKPGGRSQKSGRDGQDLTLTVPPGTLIYDVNKNKMIADLTKLGEEVIIAKGGKGGLGNTHYKSSTNQAPRKYKPGSPGEEVNLRLELELIADVGLIGMPSSGKSTLLSVISNAKPKVASYPFTTLEPNLGLVNHNDKRFVVADIPGLIEGASKGKGLGHKFLKHILRTKILVHLVDATDNNAKDNYQKIRKELEDFSKELISKDEIIVLSKSDIKQEEPEGLDYDIEISSATNHNINELLDIISQKI